MYQSLVWTKQLVDLHDITRAKLYSFSKDGDSYDPNLAELTVLDLKSVIRNSPPLKCFHFFLWTSLEFVDTPAFIWHSPRMLDPMWCWLYLRHQIQAVALCCQKKGPGSKSFGLQVLNDKVAMSMATQRSNFHVRKAMGEISSEIFGGPKSQKNHEKWQGDYLAFGLGDDGKWHILFEGDYFLVEVALRRGSLDFHDLWFYASMLGSGLPFFFGWCFSIIKKSL